MLRLLYAMATPWAKANRAQILKNRLLGAAANILYPVWCGLVPVKRQRGEAGSGVIVSLTSYPARISKLHLCIESLLRQSLPADQVILWLAEEQFADRQLPEKLTRLTKQGLEIRFCEDLRSYKKIFYTAQEFGNCPIVTADDDTLYPEDWLSRLVSAAREYPDCVVCYRAHKMTLDSAGRPLPYQEWEGLSPDFKGPSGLLVAVGVGGVCYPPHFFASVVFDYGIIKELAPSADDLWLKVIGLQGGYRTVKVAENSIEWFTIRQSQKTSLMQGNVGASRNDAALRKLMDHYQVGMIEYGKEGN